MDISIAGKERSEFVRAALAVVLSIALACLLRWALDPLLVERPYVLFLAAVAASTCVGGWRAGAVTVVIAVALNMSVLARPSTPRGILGSIGSALVFIFTASIVVGALAREIAARRESERRGALLRREVSERERLERELDEARRLEGLGRLAGGVAHDFNNLLMVIQGSSEVLHKRMPDDGLVRSIQMAATRGADLTKQLLGFARRQIMQVQALALNEVVEEVTRLAERLIPEDIEIEVSLKKELWPFQGDAAQVQQVLLSLLTYARDALPNGGRIRVVTDNVFLSDSFVNAHFDIKAGEYVLLRVCDNGPGMSEELRSRIFEPFVSAKERGRDGLGLAMAYGIVKQLHGSIFVHSAPGEGTVFDVYWPRDKSCDSVPHSESKTMLRRRVQPLRVLLVEDDAAVRRVTADMLQTLGHDVTVAEDGLRALAIADTMHEPAAVLVTDVVMPGMNGRELFEHLRRLWPMLSVVFVSGYTDDVVLTRGVVEPYARLVRKPFTGEELEQALREIIAKGEGSPAVRIAEPGASGF